MLAVPFGYSQGGVASQLFVVLVFAEQGTVDGLAAKDSDRIGYTSRLPSADSLLLSHKSLMRLSTST